MTTLTRWLASTDPADKTGVATFSAHGTTVHIPLESFDDARQLDEFIDRAVLKAKNSSRVAIANFVRGTAAQIEHGGVA